MSGSGRRIRLTVKAIAAARSAQREYTLWHKLLAHFGVRVQPSGVKSWIVQTRVNGRRRKITLGRFPELSLDAARRDGAAALARLWGGEDMAAPRRTRAPRFRDFAARYHERRKHRWKPSSLESFGIYMRNRLMPHFGRLRLDAIDHVRGSAWFDAAGVDRPGAANRAFEILRAMLATARQWGDLGEQVPDTCASIVRNPRRPVAGCLDRPELERLGAVLDRRREAHPWSVAAIRLLTLTGARLSEILDLTWDEIGELGEDGAGARLADTGTGPRTVWLGPEAARVLAALPCIDGGRVFHGDPTSSRLYTFRVGVRDEAGLPGFRIHDCRHPRASQWVRNGVGLTTVGALLWHRRRETTAIYAHLDDGALPGRCRAGRRRHRPRHGIQGQGTAAAGRRGAPRCGSRHVRFQGRGAGRAGESLDASLGQSQGHRANGWHRSGSRRGGLSREAETGMAVSAFSSVKSALRRHPFAQPVPEIGHRRRLSRMNGVEHSLTLHFRPNWPRLSEMSMQTLSAKEVKYGFGRLIDLARAEPVTVAKHGRPAVVVLSVEEYERLKSLDSVEASLARQKQR